MNYILINNITIAITLIISVKSPIIKVPSNDTNHQRKVNNNKCT